MFKFSVLIEKIRGEFVAHCLELDITAVAKDVDAVRRQMEELISDQILFAIENDNLENLYRPAPKAYWAKFAKSAVVN